MKKHLLFALTLGMALTAPLSAAVAMPAQFPHPRAPHGSFLDYYDRLPGKHFAVFGGVNRRSLLKRKGAIVDYKNNFIEIPGSRFKNGDLESLQIKLFPGEGNVSWIGVSRAMWHQKRRRGTLHFYRANSDADAWELGEAPAEFFPYKLGKTSLSFENAYLSRRGLSIQFMIPNSDSGGYKFTFSLKGKDVTEPKNPWIRTVTEGN